MSESSESGSGREAAVSVPEARVLEPIEITGNEIRLAVRLTFREASDQSGEHPSIPFSERKERINYESPGTLNYHLDTLTGQ